MEQISKLSAVGIDTNHGWAALEIMFLSSESCSYFEKISLKQNEDEKQQILYLVTQNVQSSKILRWKGQIFFNIIKRIF